MDDFILAVSRFRRRRFDQTIDLCNKMLESQPNDQVPSCFLSFHSTSKLGGLAFEMSMSYKKELP